MGALIGGFVALVGLFITIKYEREKEEDNRRLQVIPYLKYKYLEFSEVKDKEQFKNNIWVHISPKQLDSKLLECNNDIKGYVIIENIGLCPAVEVNILEISYDGIQNFGRSEISTIEVNKNGVFYLTIISPQKEELKKDTRQSRDIRIIIGYSDLLGNYYEQTIEMTLRWFIHTMSDDFHNVTQEDYSFGCGINNVSRPIVYKDKDIKYEKLRRIDEFLNKNKGNKISR